MRKHTDEELLNELVRIKKLLGRNPKQTDFVSNSKYSVNSYKRAFGGLSKALIKIGEKPNIKLDADNYDIKEQIIKVYNVIKRPPSIEDINALSDVSYTAIRRLTKDKPWHTLLIESGIPVEEMAGRIKRSVTNDELRLEILRLKEKLGRYPNYYDMIRDGIYSCNTYELRFGSYLKAMKALGFTDYQNQSIYHNQIHTSGKDGLVYKSMFEAEIANYLYDMKQQNKIQDYLYEQPICSEKTWTCDFVVTLSDKSKIWIEADGMGNTRAVPYGPDNEKIKYYIDNCFRFYVVKYRRKISPQLDKILNCCT
jgi:hypothetical protein